MVPNSIHRSEIKKTLVDYEIPKNEHQKYIHGIRVAEDVFRDWYTSDTYKRLVDGKTKPTS